MTRAEVRAAILGDNASVRDRFRALFGEEVECTVTALADGYGQFQRVQLGVAATEHAATVQLFVHAAFASVTASLHHLVSGYSVAAGHMMRQFTECVAMALLCLDERTGVYSLYAQKPERYPVHRAPERLRRREVARVLEARVRFAPDAWETVLAMSKLYDHFSHASVVTLTFHTLLGASGGVIIGAEFDEAKVHLYRSDVTRRRSAAESLAQLAPVIVGALPRATT